jgi:adenosylmethionine-8-amino-7-oxononanoate aminotransferase
MISCMPSYHGSTIATLGIDGDESLLPFLEGFATIHEKVPAPFSYRVPGGVSADTYAQQCVRALETTIERLGPETVLGFIIEPVGGLATGCLVPPDSYFRGVREICSRHGIYLVFDEVLCGSGRTGKFLTAHHHPDAKPDIVVLAKGLGAGYAPLGATLASHSMVEEIAAGGGFNFMHTYAANPVSCAAGIAVLEEYRTGGLIERAAMLGERIGCELNALKAEFPVIGDVRGRGLLYAVELVEDAVSKRPFSPAVASVPTFRRLALDSGLMIYARQTAGGKYGDWFMVSPPFTMTNAEADEMVYRLRQTLTAFTARCANSACGA